MDTPKTNVGSSANNKEPNSRYIHIAIATTKKVKTKTESIVMIIARSSPKTK